MDEHSGFKPETEEDDDPTVDPAEGVRIIGAEEAAEAIERGHVARRRGDELPRYGDRPAPPPQGPRPVLRFPLGSSSDPTAIERTPVQPPPEPDPERALGFGDHGPEHGDDAYLAGPGTGGAEDGPLWDDARWESEQREELPWDEGRWGEPPRRGEDAAEVTADPRAGSPTSEPISEPVELPHWTEPATGEVPRILGGPDDEEEDDLDAWSSFTGASPRWRDTSTDRDALDFDDVGALGDDEPRLGALDESDRPPHDDAYRFDELDAEPERAMATEPEPTGANPVVDDDLYPGSPVYVPPSREEGDTRRAERRRRAAARADAGDGGSAGRDVSVAVGVGVAVAAVALVLFALGPGFAVVLVTAIVVFAAAELFSALRRAGYQPATLLGLVAVGSLSLAVYWRGEAAYPLVLFLVVAFALLWYLLGVSEEEPVINLGVTMLGVFWVGMVGSFGSLILTIDGEGVSILLAAVLATVGYDVGGFAVGRRLGRRPLSAMSPSKTVEGLIGGMVAAVLVAVVIVGALPGIGPFGSFGDALLLGIAVAVAAPVGDLCESMVKRELGIKDMGTILPGHGGVLDRFDAMLFVLPATYYVVRLIVA